MRRLLVIVVIMLAGCSGNETQMIRQVVDAQVMLYPDASLQDLYKAFAQAEFGPEHMIADTASAGHYLDYELGAEDRSKVLYEPLGADSSFFRVHLCAVQSGKITRDELFGAFIGGSRKVGYEEIRGWKDKWHQIEQTIESMDLELECFEEDRQKIDSLLDKGNYAIHHSAVFKEHYEPHYRIVRKDIFYEKLYDKLK